MAVALSLCLGDRPGPPILIDAHDGQSSQGDGRRQVGQAIAEAKSEQQRLQSQWSTFTTAAQRAAGDRTMMGWYTIEDRPRWLLTEAQLKLYLAERGIEVPPDLPIADRFRRTALYSPSECLDFCEAHADRV
jgi:hypothetical protein